ncbi:MAG: Nif3-like dinuclear metal center hexameric protein [Deltaproteobacteria bacterium]|nr:Nif3-like dinuclear metal center hexameric protein [Deltaproteobacteria bacterium]
MPATVQDILNIIETLAPASLAEPWDNVGLMIGSPADPVTSILLGLDPTTALLDEAGSLNADLAITHHPVIFHPLKSVRLEQPDGRFIRQALIRRINVISCHTNLDSTVNGVSDTLARQLGLGGVAALVVDGKTDETCGLGRIGDYAAPVAAAEFVRRLKEICRPPWLLTAGPRPEKISRVAVCGGSCSEYAEIALQSGAQVFVTAEVKHSVARWAEQAGLWIIDAGHYATESPAMHQFALQLARAARPLGHIDIHVTERQASPLQLL